MINHRSLFLLGDLCEQITDTLTIVRAADSLCQCRADVEDDELAANGTLLDRDRVRVGDHNLVDVSALFNLTQRVATENSVGGNDIDLLGTVTDKVIGCLQE